MVFISLFFMFLFLYVCTLCTILILILITLGTLNLYITAQFCLVQHTTELFHWVGLYSLYCTQKSGRAPIVVNISEAFSIILNFCFLFLPPLKLHVKQQQWNVHGDDWRADRAGVHDAVQERVLESERRKRYADELREAEARRHSDYIR